MRIILLIFITLFLNGCKTTEILSSIKKVSTDKVVSEKREFKKASKSINSISGTCHEAMLNMITKYAVNKTSGPCFLLFDKKEYQTAFKICKPLAENGDAFSQFAIATLYDEGKGGVDRNFNTAFTWWKKAAEQGMVFPQFKVGIMYLDGLGIQQDYKLAFKWHNLAAKQNFCGSQSSLGYMYNEGIGVPQSYKMAFKWYKIASEMGDSIAQSGLGAMYSKGLSVRQDYVKAHMWYNLSGVEFDSQKRIFMPKKNNMHKINVARHNKSIIEKFMTNEEIVKAQDLAEKCYKNKFKGC